MEVKRRACRQLVRHSFAETTGAASRSRQKPPDLSLGASCSGERRALAAARHWRTASPGTRRMFISKPDRSVELTLTAQSLKSAWDKINEKLWEGLSKFSAADWAGRHTAISEDEFKREPNRNKFTVLLGRTAHMSYHVGQATLARPKAKRFSR